jgi:hypothetical protein
MSATTDRSSTPPRERPEIAPYVVRDSGQSLEEIRAAVNYSLHHTYAADFTKGAGMAKVVADPLFHYERLLRRLREIPAVRFRTMEDLMSGGHDPAAISVTIRHDVDGDIEVCRPMAELEAAHDIPTTYYILHTAFYYGRFEDGAFLRHECMGPWYRGLQDLGHEISLHTDPLLIYQEHRIDGAAAVREEIAWLRSLGIRVPGTAAHNHTSVYGAQNYEIFAGRVRNHVMPGGTAAPTFDEDEVWFKDRWAPLHVLDEAELGLSYEGHDAYAQPGYLGIMAEIRYATINQTWNVQTDWYDRGLRQGPGSFDDLDVALGRLRPGDAIVFTTHPLYYGARLDETSAPVLAADAITVTEEGPLDGPTYAPGSVIAVSDHDGDRQIGQAINFANELGMLSRPVPAPPSAAAPGDGERDAATATAATAATPATAEPPGHRVLILGGASVDGRRVGIHAQLECRLEEALRAGTVDPVHVRSAAWPETVVERWPGWWTDLHRAFAPDLLVLVLPEDVAAGSIAAPPWSVRLRWWLGGGRPGAVRRVVRRARAAGVPVIGTWEGTPDEGFRAIFAQARIPTIDLSAAFETSEHPGARWRPASADEPATWTEAGHRIAAESLAEAVRTVLTGRSPEEREATP